MTIEWLDMSKWRQREYGISGTDFATLTFGDMKRLYLSSSAVEGSLGMDCRFVRVGMDNEKKLIALKREEGFSREFLKLYSKENAKHKSLANIVLVERMATWGEQSYGTKARYGVIKEGGMLIIDLKDKLYEGDINTEEELEFEE